MFCRIARSGGSTIKKRTSGESEELQRFPIHQAIQRGDDQRHQKFPLRLVPVEVRRYAIQYPIDTMLDTEARRDHKVALCGNAP